MDPAAEQAVTRYLDDLGRMLAPAPPAQRAEVLGQVREHLDEAFAELGPEVGEQQARQVLAQVGPAADIASAALPDTAPATPMLARSWLPWLVVGLVALSLVPILGWLAAIVGIVMFLTSPLWDRRWKARGGLAFLAVPVLLVAGPLVERLLEPVPLAQSPLMPLLYDQLFSAMLLLPLFWTAIALVLAVRAARHPH